MTHPRISLRRSIVSIVASASLLLLSSCSNQTASESGSGEPSPTAPSAKPESYKRGFKADNPNHIISPFPPHNLIDISRNPKTGRPFQQGDFARDPSTGGIFQIP
ncbi:MAG: hypothetical protein CMP26_00965 [Roseibacillus sp.]|nr:hypothetical protein [Roseibacillus sp.]HAO94639.1 hypothetical protein [Verrucomicrobiales bacterium]